MPPNPSDKSLRGPRSPNLDRPVQGTPAPAPKPPDASRAHIVGTYDLGDGWSIEIKPGSGTRMRIRATRFSKPLAPQIDQAYSPTCPDALAMTFVDRTERIFVCIGTDFDDGLECPPSIERSLIFGLAGNDQITGSRGNDRIFPGAGFDRVDGGYGSDTIEHDAEDHWLDKQRSLGVTDIFAIMASFEAAKAADAKNAKE